MALQGDDEAMGSRWLTERARALGTGRALHFVVPILASAVVATAAQESYDVYRIIRPARLPSSTAVSRAAPAALSVGAIVNAHLFGVSASDAPAQHPVNVALLLTGTIATADPAVGYALLGPTGQTARFHPAGAQVADGIVLRSVYADHVEIERAGRIEVVSLPRGTLLTASLAAAAPEAREEPEPLVPQTAEIVQRVGAESDRLAAIMRVQPYLSDDSFRGIVVQPGADPSALRRLGLKAGDLIHHVNGVMIADPSRVDLLRKALESGGPVTVSLARGSEGPQEITLDSAQVAGMLSN